MPTQHQVLDFVTWMIAGCSVLHTFLPPWDFLNEFPKAQRYYRLFVYLVGYIAINGRSAVYRQISIQNPQGVNAGLVSNHEQAKQN